MELQKKKKKREKAQNPTWNSMRLEFVKKNSVQNLAKSLGYIKCYSSSSHILIKSVSNSIRYNCQKICCWTKRPKTILEIRKKAIFLGVINKPFIYILKSSATMYGATTTQLVLDSSSEVPLEYNQYQKTLQKQGQSWPF